jgi:DegV family protein with EDD domain
VGTIENTLDLSQTRPADPGSAIDRKKRTGTIAVVTDSASNLPAELVEGMGITVVPIYLHWNGSSYRDSVDISAREVYRRLKEGKDTPQTSAPSVGDFLRTYLELGTEVEEIVSIHLPENLSATIEAARLAADLARDHIKVSVIDAGTAAMGAGFVTLGAARAAHRHVSVEEIKQITQEIGSKVVVLAMLDTLKYLRRSGRIGRAAGLLGIALRIKPILFINNGVVDVVGKPRTQSRGFEMMLDEMERQVNGRPVHVAVLHANAPKDADKLREQVEAEFDCVEIFTCQFTPVMGAHTGPGLVGIAFYAE